MNLLKQIHYPGRRTLDNLWNRLYWWAKTKSYETLPSQRTLIHHSNWDYLIILDACRADYFAAEYTKFLPSSYLSFAYSAGRDTFEFLKRVFPDYYDLIYVSGATPVNSFVKSPIEDPFLKKYYGGYVPKEHFKRIVDAWNYGWDDKLGTVPPKEVTRIATDIIKQHKEERIIIHYFQPHAPYIGEYKLLGYSGTEAGKLRGKPPDMKIWENVKKGLISIVELKKAYLSNLRLVLEEVKRLLNIIDSTKRVIITSDHGELLGEDGRFGHQRIDHPKLRVIPWLVIKRKGGT